MPCGICRAFYNLSFPGVGPFSYQLTRGWGIVIWLIGNIMFMVLKDIQLIFPGILITADKNESTFKSVGGGGG